MELREKGIGGWDEGAYAKQGDDALGGWGGTQYVIFCALLNRSYGDKASKTCLRAVLLSLLIGGSQDMSLKLMLQKIYQITLLTTSKCTAWKKGHRFRFP